MHAVAFWALNSDWPGQLKDRFNEPHQGLTLPMGLARK